MEGNSAGNTQVQEQGREMSQYCLGLPTILRKLLEQFSTMELMELSLVNKLWNFEARSVMRERGNVTARMLHGCNQDESQCQKLSQFASALQNMAVIPFSGISLTISHPYNLCPISDCQLDPSHKVILDLIPRKRFSVYFWDSWDRCKYCPALLLLKHILEDFCGSLEELTLGFGKEEFLRPIFQDRTFPHLKYLSFVTMQRATAEDSYTVGFIRYLVSCAPNLRELRIDAIYLVVNVLGRSSAVVVPDGGFLPLFEPVCEEIIGSVRAHDMEICVHRHEFDPELLNGVIPTLLNGSRTTLKTLTMDLFFAVPLMCYGICLENVTRLEIRVNFNSLEEVEPSVLALAKRFDFKHVFPNLNQVAITNCYFNQFEFSFDAVSAFVPQASAVLSRALPDRAMHIKLLEIVLLYITDDSSLSLLAQMFPHVKRVHTRKEHKGASFTDLREHFPSLEEVIKDIDL